MFVKSLPLTSLLQLLIVPDLFPGLAIDEEEEEVPNAKFKLMGVSAADIAVTPLQSSSLMLLIEVAVVIPRPLLLLLLNGLVTEALLVSVPLMLFTMLVVVMMEVVVAVVVVLPKLEGGVFISAPPPSPGGTGARERDLPLVRVGLPSRPSSDFRGTRYALDDSKPGDGDREMSSTTLKSLEQVVVPEAGMGRFPPAGWCMRSLLEASV